MFYILQSGLVLFVSSLPFLIFLHFLMLPWFENNAFPLYLAPMARYTDVVYRQLCKEQGADVMVTEFVRADSLIHGGPEAWRAIDFTEEQRPMGVQIFGSTVEAMAEAARRIVDRVSPDFIDLNFGCPANCVTDKLAGSSLLRDPKLLAEIAGGVVKAVPSVAVTGKIRIGWDDQSIVAHEVGQRLQDVGVQALAIHGRTKMQAYRGDANWDIINEVAEVLSIPVIGNGNVKTVERVKEIRESSPVSGLMIGRGALGYPWIFKEIKHYLATGRMPPPPTVQERWETILSYTRLLLKAPFRSHDPNNIRWMHSKIKALTKEMPGCRRLRVEFESVTTLDDLERLAERHLSEAASGE